MTVHTLRVQGRTSNAGKSTVVADRQQLQQGDMKRDG